MNQHYPALEFSNLAQLIEHSCREFGNASAYQCLGQSLSFNEIEEKSRYLAQWFQHKTTLKQGDRIAIQLPNIIQYPIVAYAALRAGLVIVNTNPLYTSREMLHQFKDSGAKALVILSDLLPKLDSIRNDTVLDTILVTSAADLLKPGASVPTGDIPLLSAIAEGAHLPELQPSQAGLQDIAVLQYTGGTTGVAKGACLSHGNLLSNAEQMRERMLARMNIAEETFVCPLPLYHIYAFTVNMLSLFSMGNINILIPNPRDIEGFISVLIKSEITGIAGINTLFVGLCQHPHFKQVDFSRLKVTFSGGAALTSAAYELWKQVTGCTITEGWGLSETSPVVTLNHFGKEQVGSVGEPLQHTEVQVWDKHNKPLAIGQEGELVIRGPQVMLGYWNRPDETAKVMQDGFFRSGDIGLIQSDGRVKIVDRLKDMIIVSGFNVYPNEVEDILSSHPAVIEAAVVGESDERTGERVCAFVTTSVDVSVEELIRHCQQQLAAYKVPKVINFLAELPKSSVGKVLRRELRR